MLEYLKELCASMRIDGEIYTAILKPEHAVNGERIIRTDAKKAYAGKWVTINGAHVLIGRNGIVVAGAGGKFNGMNLGDGVRKVHRMRGIANAVTKYKKLRDEYRDKKIRLGYFDEQVSKWQEAKSKRLAMWGKDSRLYEDAKRRHKLWVNQRKPILKEFKEVETKFNKLKKKYPDIEQITASRSAVKERRALQQWARGNGYDPNRPQAELSNLYHRATGYRRGANGGTWTGDEDK